MANFNRRPNCVWPAPPPVRTPAGARYAPQLPAVVRHGHTYGTRQPERAPRQGHYMNTPTSPREIHYSNSPFSPTYQYWEPEVQRIPPIPPNAQLTNHFGMPQAAFNRLFGPTSPPRAIPFQMQAAMGPPAAVQIATPPPDPNCGNGLPASLQGLYSRMLGSSPPRVIPTRDTPVGMRLGAGRQITPGQGIGVSPVQRMMMMTPGNPIMGAGLPLAAPTPAGCVPGNFAAINSPFGQRLFAGSPPRPVPVGRPIAAPAGSGSAGCVPQRDIMQTPFAQRLFASSPPRDLGLGRPGQMAGRTPGVSGAVGDAPVVDIMQTPFAQRLFASSPPRDLGLGRPGPMARQVPAPAGSGGAGGAAGLDFKQACLQGPFAKMLFGHSPVRDLGLGYPIPESGFNNGNYNEGFPPSPGYIPLPEFSPESMASGSPYSDVPLDPASGPTTSPYVCSPPNAMDQRVQYNSPIPTPLASAQGSPVFMEPTMPPNMLALYRRMGGCSPVRQDLLDLNNRRLPPPVAAAAAPQPTAAEAYANSVFVQNFLAASPVRQDLIDLNNRRLPPPVAVAAAPQPTAAEAYANSVFVQNFLAASPPRPVTIARQPTPVCTPAPATAAEVYANSVFMQNLLAASPPRPIPGYLPTGPGGVGRTPVDIPTGSPGSNFPVPPIPFKTSPGGANETFQVLTGQGQGAGSPGGNSGASAGANETYQVLTGQGQGAGSPGGNSGASGGGLGGLTDVEFTPSPIASASPNSTANSGPNAPPNAAPNSVPIPPKVPTPAGPANPPGAGTAEFASSFSEEDGFLTIEFGGLEELDCSGAR